MRCRARAAEHSSPNLDMANLDVTKLDMTNPTTAHGPELIGHLRGAKRVVVLSGAGVSAESGIPTFRDRETGLWVQFDASKVATLEAFQRDPTFVWEWYVERRRKIDAAKPNAAHRAIAMLERLVPSLTLVTQNIDGLHWAAGSENVVELHGNVQRARCMADGTMLEPWDDRAPVPPLCPECGGLMRPDVVWFGEMLPRRALTAAVEAAHSCDVFISAGTSGTVEPAASLAFEALRSSAVVVEVNTEPTPLTPYVTHSLLGPAGQVLPGLVKAVWPAA